MSISNGRSKPLVCLCWFHPLVLSDFRRLLSGNGVRVCDSRMDARTLSEGGRARFARASVYVLEASTEGDLAEKAAAQLLILRPGARILIAAERFDQERAFSLLRLGVKGLLSFAEAPTNLRRAVREISRDGFWVSRALLSRFIDSTVRSLQPRNPQLLTVPAHLSRREHEVCGLLLENLSNREIADRLKVSERTAKFHVSNLLAKCGLKRRADLVVLSYEQLHLGNGLRRIGRLARPNGG